MNTLFKLLAIGTTICSCQHVYYAPNTANIPMLTEKGEVRINANYVGGGDSEFEGGEVQAAYAINNRLGVMANFFSAGKTESIEDGSGGSHVESGSGSYFEAAAGYLHPVDLKKKWVAEVYGGIGFGGVKNEYENSNFSKVGIVKFFLQPSIGYKSAYFEAGFTPKLSLVNWKVKEEKITSGNEDAQAELAVIKGDPSFVVFEPAILIRAGGKNLKIHGGLSFSGYDASNYGYETGLTETLTGSLGISVLINPPKK